MSAFSYNQDKKLWVFGETQVTKKLEKKYGLHHYTTFNMTEKVLQILRGISKNQEFLPPPRRQDKLPFNYKNWKPQNT